MGPAGGDRLVADVVALDPGAEVEDALHHPLSLLHRLREGPHHVLEAADRRRHRPLQHPDLVVVLDQAQLAQLPGQPGLFPGVLGAGDQGVHGRVEPAQHQHRPVEPAHRLAQAVERGAVDVEQVGRLLHPPSGTDPELPGARIGEEGGRGAVGARLEVEGRVVALAGGAEQEDATGLGVPGQPVVVAAGPEAVVVVVGPHLRDPARDQQMHAGEEGGEGRATLPVAGGRRMGALREAAARRPVAGHQLDERRGGARVVGPGALTGRGESSGEPPGRAGGRWLGSRGCGGGLVASLVGLHVVHPRSVPGGQGGMGERSPVTEAVHLSHKRLMLLSHQSCQGQTSPRQ